MACVIFGGGCMFTPIRFGCQLVYRVVFVLPPSFFSTRQRYGREVPRFIRVFRGVTHRIFDAFDLVFRVVFKRQFATGAIGRRFELFFGVVRERDRVPVTISFLRQSPFAVEFQLGLIRQCVDIPAAFSSKLGLHKAR